MDEYLEQSRGETRVGHTGYIAWIDGMTRKVHVQKGKCIATREGFARILTDDREIELNVPHGRLQWSAAAACEQLAIDVREESERSMRPIQEKLAGVARQLLLDLIAIELAKKEAGGSESGKLLEQHGLKKLEGPK
jgi:hypothetical protein